MFLFAYEHILIIKSKIKIIKIDESWFGNLFERNYEWIYRKNSKIKTSNIRLKK